MPRGLIPDSLLCKTNPKKSPSFPHVFSGGSTGLATGEIPTGPPINTFGGDNPRKNSHKRFMIPRSSLRGRSIEY